MEPVLFIKCLFSQDIVPISEKLRIPLLTVYDLRSIVTRKVGLPISKYIDLSIYIHIGQKNYRGRSYECMNYIPRPILNFVTVFN